MNNADKPVYPTLELDYNESIIQGRNVFFNQEFGLTKREYFAGLALQGLCAFSIIGSHRIPINLIEEAIEYADELLKQLENE